MINARDQNWLPALGRDVIYVKSMRKATYVLRSVTEAYCSVNPVSIGAMLNSSNLHDDSSSEPFEPFVGELTNETLMLIKARHQCQFRPRAL